MPTPGVPLGANSRPTHLVAQSILKRSARQPSTPLLVIARPEHMLRLLKRILFTIDPTAPNQRWLVVAAVLLLSE